MSKEVGIFMPPKENGGFFDRDIVQDFIKELTQKEKIKEVHQIDISKCVVIDGNIFYDNLNVSKMDLFLWYAKGIKKYLDILRVLANDVKIITDPYVFDIVNDKLKAHSKLRSFGVDVSEYALIAYDDFDSMKNILKDWQTLLIKPRRGSYGRGIIKVDNFDTLRDIAGILELQAREKHIFVEKFYPHTLDDWVSVVVINFKAIYGYRKKEEKFTDWKVYDIYKEGGNAVEAKIEDVRNIAEKSAKILDSRIVCFDILKTNTGYKIIDENNFPGLYNNVLEQHKTTIAKVFANLVCETLA